MSDKIIVTTEDLIQAATKVDELAGEYSVEYNAMYKDVENLVSTGYSGPQGEAFKTQIEGFKDDFEKMHQLLEEYADHLRTAAKTYDDAKESSITSISSLQN